MKYTLSILFTFIFSIGLLAQTNQELKLAQQFFQRGEYEKAAPLYKKLYEENAHSSYYYNAYFKTLIALKQFDDAERLIKKRKKSQKGKRGEDLTLTVDKGYLFLQQEKIEEAEEEFQNAINKLKKDNLVQIRSLATSFSTYDQLDFMVTTYQKGREIEGNPAAYAYELALAYKKKGKFKEMINAYLDYVIVNPQKIQVAKNEFYKAIAFEENRDHLEEELYRRIQADGNQVIYPELLTWMFVQEKDYESAFIQVKALDKRLDENGKRVFELAQTAALEKQWDAAVDAYGYVVEKGTLSPMYQPARIGLLNCQMSRIENSIEYTDQDVLDLEQNYIQLLNDLGKNPNTVSTMRDLAKLYALYIYDLGKAIALLEEVVAMPAASGYVKGKCKLDLGDYYIMDGDVWEAALYYMQVDKDFKDDILGEEARFKNSKLAYFNGDFEWAQSQLNILKASTSELISNDAIELSVFIIDNMGLDTSATAMQMFARADLLLFQNRTDDAYKVLDSLDNIYPGHYLADDILFKRGEIEYKRRDYKKAEEYWQKVLSDFGEDILADNALFRLGDLYQNQFDDPSKAMEYYEQVIIDHPGSLFTVEARKRYRGLRGDALN